ncbi:MAG TPA: hypothetical protein DIC41_09905, partial [Alphaproteobacteria bacterium]|nr:hypothetical protein [Alphaproteobacteria bacterium]
SAMVQRRSACFRRSVCDVIYGAICDDGPDAMTDIMTGTRAGRQKTSARSRADAQGYDFM